MKLLAALVWAVTAISCGDNGFVEPDASVFVHTPLPEILPHTFNVLAHPKLVTLTYSNYPDKANVETWGDAVVGSQWYTTAVRQYGIGPMTHELKFSMGTAPTTLIEDVDVEAKIQSLITAGSLPAPPVDNSDYIYMFYIPASVPIGDTLSGLYGYHAMLTRPDGARFAYAVIVDDGSGLDTTTSTAAHELAEAATNPYDLPYDGWYTDPGSPDPWSTIVGEVGDLCNYDPLYQEGAFAYQRIWSNTAAAASQNPCVPNDGDVYETVSSDPAMMPTIAKGASAVFKLTGWSTGQEADWTLDTDDVDYSDLVKAQITPTFSSMTINDHKSVTLTLHAPPTARSGDVGAIYVFSGTYSRPWVVGFIVQE